VFGSLAWADFEAIAETHAAGRFQLVADRFDRAVDAIENARDQVVGAFDVLLRGRLSEPMTSSRS
jgi:hypothetical protein